MDYLIGIDAGGTKTRAKAFDLDGNCLMEEIGGPGNITVNFENTVKVLHTLLVHIQSNLEGTCKFLLVGISGIDTSGKSGILSEIFDQYAEEVRIINDAELGVLNKLHGEDGMLVIAGTGSVAFFKKGSLGYRQGGWGHLIGDEGSAYWIGLQCYKQLSMDYDSAINHTLTPFSKEFLRYLNVSSPLEAIKNIYTIEKTEVAKIAQFVAEQADTYEESREILIQAGKNLAELAKRLLIKVKAKYNTPVAVTGSVLEKNSVVFNTFTKELINLTTNIILDDEENTKAVWYLYNKEAGL